MMAVSPTQVAYARELREYSLATLLALLVLLSLDRLLDARLSLPRVAIYTAAACAAVLVQFGLVIVVAVSQVHYLATFRRAPGAWRLRLGSSVCIGLATLGTYLFGLRGILTGRTISFSYLDPNYLGLSTPLGVLDHLWTNSLGLLRLAFLDLGGLGYWPEAHALSEWHPLVFGVLTVAGVAVLWSRGRQGRRHVLYLLLPIAAVFALSCVGIYPYGDGRQTSRKRPYRLVSRPRGNQTVGYEYAGAFSRKALGRTDRIGTKRR
jgi:hypothetical protein